MYLALMDDAVLPLNRPLWKIKIPLKVKVFLWLLHRGVILTKDNLAKRNWNGSKLCSCCQNDETIAHLFFNCQMACLLWRIISITFGLSKPNSVVHLFGTWLQGLKRRQKNIMFPGLCALLWAVWLSRNDIVFQKNSKTSCSSDSFQGYILHQDVGDSSKGGGQENSHRCLSHPRSNGNGHLRTQRVAV